MVSCREVSSMAIIQIFISPCTLILSEFFPLQKRIRVIAEYLFRNTEQAKVEEKKNIICLLLTFQLRVCIQLSFPRPYSPVPSQVHSRVPTVFISLMANNNLDCLLCCHLPNACFQFCLIQFQDYVSICLLDMFSYLKFNIFTLNKTTFFTLLIHSLL